MTRRFVFVLLLNASAAALILEAGMATCLHGQTGGATSKIAPEIRLKDFLSAPSKEGDHPGIVGYDELTLLPGIRGSVLFQVPEVHFEDPAVLNKLAAKKQGQHILRQINAINELNEKEADRFIGLVERHRPDLSGLPFLKGDACRLKKEYAQEFARAVRQVRLALFLAQSELDSGDFVAYFRKTVAAEKRDREPSIVNRARIAACMQILVAQPLEFQKHLVRYLSSMNQEEATLGLARLAVFPYNEEIRRAALAELTKRDTKVIDKLLFKGLRYPYPAVVKNAAEVVVRLKRRDLAPKLAALLDEPDPLAPIAKQTNGNEVWVVREVVRMNHHRNCLLCHSPGNSFEITRGLTGPVPSPGSPLPFSAEAYYVRRNPDIFVRADVTYLRQDFTLLMRVRNADPWPEMQRFDFLVRTRALTPKEVSTYQESERKRKPGRISPIHRTIRAALRQLTGKQTDRSGTDAGSSLY